MQRNPRLKFSEGEVGYDWDRYFAMGQGSLTPMQVAVLVCVETGWTYDEFLDQPAEFVENVIEMLRARAEDAKRKAHANG